jgi:hypothetical protein
MTLVVMGLLLGLVGIVRMTVLDIVYADRHGPLSCSRKSQKASGKSHA